MGSKVLYRGGTAQSTSKKLPAREFIGQPSPAPRRSCPKQAGRHHREEVIGQHKSQKRSGCPKYEQKTSREEVYWAAKSRTAEELPKTSRKTPPRGSYWAAKSSTAEELPKVRAKNFPRGSLMGSQVQHRVGTAQSKPESTTAREFNGQPRPAPRLSCPKQAGKHHREEVYWAPSPAPRQRCPN